MVSTDTLMIIAGLVLVESVRGEVQHTVVQTLVLEYLLVGGCHLLRCLTLTLRNEHAIVEVSLVHLPHIYQTEHRHRCHGIYSLHFPEHGEEQQYRSCHYHPERAPAVGCEDSLSHSGDVCHQRTELVGWYLRQGMALSYGDVVEEHSWHHGEHGGDACCQHETDGNIPQQLLLIVIFQHFLQCHHSQEGYGKFGYDEYRGYRPELGIHRYIVEEEVGHRHEVPTPRQQYRQYGSGKKCPFHRTFHYEQSKYKQHQHEGSYIHWSARTWLVAPILAQLLVYLFIHRIGFLLYGLVVYHRHRRTTLGVRHQQRPCLVYSVAPLCDIVAIQTAIGLIGRVLLHQLALASHRLVLILPRMV